MKLSHQQQALTDQENFEVEQDHFEAWLTENFEADPKSFDAWLIENFGPDEEDFELWLIKQSINPADLKFYT